MSIGRLGMIVPMDPPGDIVLNGFLLSVVDGVPRVDVFHSKAACRALLEEMIAPETSEMVEDHAKLLERSTLPEASELPTLTFPFWLSANLQSTLLTAANAADGLATTSARMSTIPHVYRLLLPAKPPADSALLALVDAAQAVLYIIRSKAQGRELVARHAGMMSPATYAAILGHFETCDHLPETVQEPAVAVLGYAAMLFCISCGVLDARQAKAN